MRPTAKDLRDRLAELDEQRPRNAPSMFSDCCRPSQTSLPQLEFRSSAAIKDREVPSWPGLSREELDAASLGDNDTRPPTSIFDSVGRSRNTYPSTLGTSHGRTNPKDQNLGEVHEDDADTTYSVDSSADDSGLEYIRAFALRLAKEINVDTRLSSMSNIPEAEFSDIMKMFAGRLHEESTNPFEREASVALHRKRE